MNNIKKLSVVLLSILFLSCSSNKHEFPLEKKYWDVEDYESVVRELRFGYKDDEKLPSVRDSETKEIVEKLTNADNFTIVLDDQQLGIKHKNEVAQTFFDRFKDMSEIYIQTDRQDKYLYDLDFIKVWHFGLELQLRYFSLGNDKIKETSDDANSEYVQNLLKSNVQTLIGNYIYYLDFLNEEKAFSDEGLKLLSEGIDVHFTKLISEYPNADYSSMLEKVKLLEKKNTNSTIQTSLSHLKNLLENNQKKV